MCKILLYTTKHKKFKDNQNKSIKYIQLIKKNIYYNQKLKKNDKTSRTGKNKKNSIIIYIKKPHQILNKYKKK